MKFYKMTGISFYHDLIHNYSKTSSHLFMRFYPERILLIEISFFYDYNHYREKDLKLLLVY